MNGGGKEPHSPIASWGQIASGLWDEFGISHTNDAIVDIGPLYISIEAPHSDDEWDKDEVTILVTQFFMIDAERIEYLGPPAVMRPRSNVWSDYARPTSRGRWGHYKVGNDILRCEELRRVDRKVNYELLRSFQVTN